MAVSISELKSFLLKHASEMTNKWLSLRKIEDEKSIYSNHMPYPYVQEVKSSNLQLIELIVKNLGDVNKIDLSSWGETFGEIRAKNDTPIYHSLEQIKIFRKIFWGYFTSFVEDNKRELSHLNALEWGKQINYLFDSIIETFTKSYFHHTNKRLTSQQEMIDELSTPIISIIEGVAVLPLIGDIDTHRAKVLMEHALHESLRKAVNCLIIDLSGVLIVDTMVAQELFKIISALKLTGVEVKLTGMRPELAHSVVAHGVRFEEVKMFNNLHQALKSFGIVRT